MRIEAHAKGCDNKCIHQTCGPPTALAVDAGDPAAALGPGPRPDHPLVMLALAIHQGRGLYMAGIKRHTTVAILGVLMASIPAAVVLAAEPSLTAVPQSALIDQPVTIEVEHCRPNQVVVLRAVCFDDDGQRWR